MLLVLSFQGFCQQQIEFEKFSDAQVISQSITYDIEQDSIGNLWIASEEGVVKYNSKSSRIYNSYKGLPSEMGNRVRTLFIDSNGIIWAGMEKGVCIYDETNDEFSYVGSNPMTGPNQVKSFSEDYNGNIYAAGFNGLWRYKEEGENSLFQKVAAQTNIQSLLAYDKGLLIGSSSGLALYDNSKEKLVSISEQFNQLNIVSLAMLGKKIILGTKSQNLYLADLDLTLPKQILSDVINQSYPINDIELTPNGGLFIATDGDGIYEVNNALTVTGHFTQNEDDPTSISSNGIYDIHQGLEGIIWIATYGGGINKIDPRKSIFQKIRHRYNDKNSIKNNFTRAIEKDVEGNIWFGTKGGLSIWDRVNNNWQTVPSIENVILDLQADGHYMWVGTYNNGAYKIDVKTLSIVEHYGLNSADKILLNKVYAICKDDQNNTWLGGIEGDLTMIHHNGKVTYFPIRNVRSIIRSKPYKVLVGAKTGVFEIDSRTDEIKPIDQVNPSNETGLSYVTVNALQLINNTKIMVSTNGEGLLIYDRAIDTLQQFNRKVGMPSDNIQGAIALDENNIWASSVQGLIQLKINGNENTIYTYDGNDGLSSTEFNYGSYAKINDKELIFGGLNGATLFNPKNIKKQTLTPKVEFVSYSLLNKELAPGEGPLSKHVNFIDRLNLDYNQNAMAFNFIGVLHREPTKLKYSWKLDGLEEEWANPTKEHLANYTNLDPGNYVFRVKASNSEGEWGPTRVLPFFIKSPWWATTTAYWIYSLGFVLLILGIILLTRFIVNKRRAEEQIDFFNNITHEIRTPLTILLSSLDESSITESEDKSNKKVKTTVKRLSSLFEQLLNFQKVTSRHDSLKDISKFSINQYVDTITDNFKPLLEERKLRLEIVNRRDNELFYYNKEDLNKIVYNLISNSIKYSKKDGKVTVTLLPSKNGELKFSVADDGIGIPQDQQKHILKRYYRARNVTNSQEPGVGLGLMIVKNLVERENGIIDFESEENKGTTFTVTLRSKELLYKNMEVDGRTLPDNPVSLDHSLQAQEYSDCKVLIVEDNNELRSTLSNILGVYFQVFEASNGVEGLELAAQYFPDIILTDLIMPEMDGMEMSKALQQDINLNHIPIFMMTVLHSSSQKLESIGGGIAEYIEKPIDFDLLIAKMVSLLGLQARMRQKYVHDAHTDEANLYRTKSDEEFVTNLEKYVIEKLDNESFSVHDLCDKVSMSRTSLYNKLKSLVDLSPQDFIINTKLRFAKKLLIQGDSNIKEVAYQAGFSNPKYFSTSFKKHFGISPSAFLSSLQDG